MKLPVITPLYKNIMRGLSIGVWTITMLSAFGGVFDPSEYTIPAVACLCFPYLLILSVILIIFWIFNKSVIFTIFGIIAVIACSDTMKVAFPLNFSKSAPADAQTFKIMSWNLIHTDDLRKPDYPGNRAVEYMVNSEADIICCAELLNFSSSELKKASPTLIDSLIRKYPFRAGLSSTDIKIMSKYPVDRAGLSYISQTGHHRFDFFKVHFPGGKVLYVAMCHLYSYDLTEEERNVMKDMKSMSGAKESMKEFKTSIGHKLKNAFIRRAANAEELRAAINTIRPTAPLIVCGDFNDVPASWTYNIIKGDDMRDAYAETNFGPTWTYNLHLFYFHIDQMLYRGKIDALSLKVGKINTSDHYPLIGEFAFTE